MSLAGWHLRALNVLSNAGPRLGEFTTAWVEMTRISIVSSTKCALKCRVPGLANSRPEACTLKPEA